MTAFHGITEGALLLGLGAVLAGTGSLLNGVAALRAARKEKCEPKEVAVETA